MPRMREGRLAVSRELRERSVVYRPSRCAACNRRIRRSGAVREGRFPILTPEGTLQVRARVCAECLAAAGPSGVRRLALAVFRHLAAWYARGRDADALPAETLARST